jgi:hypothetical protein
MVMSGMHERPAGTAARIWAAAVSAMLLSLAAGPILSQEPSPVLILDSINDSGSDPDSDGLYEYLVLGVPLRVEKADVYTVGAQVFVLGADAPLARSGQTLFLDAGEQSVKLTFAGSALAPLPPDQKLLFKIVVSDSTQKAVDARTFVGPEPYSGLRFEGAPGPASAEFTGRVLEVPEPVGAAGRFGYLNITFEVRNLSAKNVEVNGYLNRLVRGTGILRSRSAGNLTAQAELRFDGGAIRGLGAPGPFNVTVRLLLDTAGEVFYEYRTAPYGPDDFEAPAAPVAFTGNGTDGGMDTDGDGLFDQLTVQVEVDIALEGACNFKAALRLPERYRAVQDMVPRSTASQYFPAGGRHVVPFNFSGTVFRILQLDGPYTLLLDAFSERVLFVANGTYTTKAYLSTQFESGRLPARFSGGAAVEAMDRDQNGRYEVLKVTAPVEVSSAGSYQLAGTVFAAGRFVTWAGGKLPLGAGPAKVACKFEGAAIGRPGFDGPYTIVLYLSAAADDRSGLPAYLPPDRLEVQTKAYRAAEFEGRALPKKPLPPPEDPELKIGEGSYILRAAGITAEVNRSSPDITFYYTLDDGRSARFRLVFSQLAAYNDLDGNGVRDAGEERYLSPLPVADWQASKVESSGEQGGRVLRYNLSAVLDLWAVGRRAGLPVPEARIPQWGRLTFSFTLSSRDQDFTRPVAFSLRGGTELKIDILIEPGRDLPGGISGLALQHYLSDESGQNFFSTFESDRTRIFRPGADGANGTIFRAGLTSLSKIGLSGQNRKEHGHYSWLPQVLVNGQDGSSAYRPVNLTYSTDGRQMALELNYPLSGGTAALLHDPTVGVNATNAPGRLLTVGARLFNLVVYVLAVVLAVAVVAVIRRSQRNGG